MILSPAKTSGQKGYGCFGCLTSFVILILILIIVPLYCTSPAFTQRKKTTYSQVVTFITGVEQKYKIDDVLLGGDTKRLEVHLSSSKQWVKASTILTPAENQEGLRLCSFLWDASCRGAYTQDSLIFLFRQLKVGPTKRRALFTR